MDHTPGPLVCGTQFGFRQFSRGERTSASHQQERIPSCRLGRRKRAPLDAGGGPSRFLRAGDRYVGNFLSAGGEGPAPDARCASFPAMPRVRKGKISYFSSCRLVRLTTGARDQLAQGKGQSSCEPRTRFSSRQGLKPCVEIFQMIGPQSPPRRGQGRSALLRKLGRVFIHIDLY